MKSFTLTLKPYLIVLNLFLFSFLFGQTPEKMSYQAVVRNSSNGLVSNHAVGTQISILQGSAIGTALYVETHTVNTNANGLMTLEIGNGTVQNGNISNIDWSNGSYFLKTETDPDGGTNYTISGVSQLLSVPYALHAKTADNLTVSVSETDPVFTASPANGITYTDITNWDNKLDAEIDGDISNEIQDLQLNGNILTITNNGTATNIDLSQYLDDTDTQLTETEVDLMVSNNGYLTSEIDGDISNEIQDLQLNGNILTITNNGTATNIDLSQYLDDTDTQLTETEVDLMVSNNGYLTSEIDGNITNEIQDLQLNGNILTITNNGTATNIDLSQYLDDTDTQLTETEVDLMVSNNGYLTSFTETDPKIGTNTSGYSPKWNSSEMVTGAIYQDALNNVGIGTTTPSTKLEVSGQVKITGGTPGAGKILTSDADGLASWQAAPGDNLGNHTATQNININGFALVSGGTRGLKLDYKGNIGINMNPQYTSNNDVNFDILSPDGWGHANVNIRGYNWATNSYKCTRGSGCDFYSGAWWSDTYNEHLFFLCSGGAEFAKGITIRKNSNVGIGTQAPSTKLDVNGVITATGGNSTSWNTAYSWGDHATFGYLTTYNETDPIFEASVAKNITLTDIANWNNKLDTEVDGSVTNEIQTLSINNNTITLSDGGSVDIPEQKSIPALISKDDFSSSTLKNYWTSSLTGSATINISNSSISLNTNNSSGVAKLISTKQKPVSQGKLVFTAVLYTYEDNNIAWGPLSRGLVNGFDRNNAIEFINVSGNTVQARTVSGGTATTTNYILGASVANFYSYTIIATSNKVEFYIDGALIATHTTNIPTVPLNMYFDASTSSGNVPQTIDDAKFEIILN